jgi:hypothetical protein
VELPPAISPIFLQARVVHSVAVDTEDGPQGERVLRSRSGVEFHNINVEEKAILARIIQRLSAEKKFAA